MSALLVEMFRHNRWANLRLLDACAELTEAHRGASVAGTRGALGDTLVHLAAAEQRYVNLMRGLEAPTKVHESLGWPEVEGLRASLEWTGNALIEIAGAARADEVFERSYQGQMHRLPISTVLIQAINHATEHRAHVATILTQQGVEPPGMDGWHYGQATGG